MARESTAEARCQDSEAPRADGFRGNGRDTLAALLESSKQLLEVLKDEAKLLREFNKDELVQLLARKQGLVEEIAALNKARQNLPGSPADTSGAGRNGLPTGNQEDIDSRENGTLLLLRAIWSDIEVYNQRNRVFIEGSLEYLQEFLSLLVPSTYCPGQKWRQEPSAPPLKGLALNREI
jgi:flagellar biosynthesis/type III secretory pathway chaperone